MFGQYSLESRGQLRYDTARDDRDDLDVERGQLYSESVGVGVESGFGSAVDTAEGIWHHCRD